MLPLPVVCAAWSGIGAFFTVGWLIAFYVFFAVIVKRFHDSSSSAFWLVFTLLLSAFVTLIVTRVLNLAFIGTTAMYALIAFLALAVIFCLYLCFAKGSIGKNRYGEKTALDLNGERILGGYPFSTYLKIADGCDNCCTYCAIPKIRGRMRSRKIEDCVAEAKRLAAGGVKELTVVAQDTTAYGEDIYGKPMLSELLRELCKIDGLHWIRTLYTYPDRITDELLETVAEEPKLVKYFDIPLQHVNGDILKRMNRKGDRKSISALIDKIREKIPGVTLRTTLITGFPGETDGQFCELAEFVKEKRFDRLGCFTYSAEEDTIAAGYTDQIDGQVKQDRADNIMELQMTIAAEKNEEKAGTETEVLIEGWDSYIKCYFGRTPADAPEVDGKIFFMSARPLKIGEFVKVRVNDCIDYDLLGELSE